MKTDNDNDNDHEGISPKPPRRRTPELPPPEELFDVTDAGAAARPQPGSPVSQSRPALVLLGYHWFVNRVYVPPGNIRSCA